MDNTNKVIYDFSNLTANEVEIETTDETEKSIENENKIKLKVDTPFFEPSDYLNGALHEDLNYSWSQSFTEIGRHTDHCE